jgi:hypothetical protein
VPADVEIDDESSSSFPLSELPRDRIPPVLRRPVADKFEVAWIWARLPFAFGFTPEPSEGEKTLLWQGFVAVPEGADTGVPFLCSDYYGKTSLTFSRLESDDVKVRVADAFWGVLLSEPNELQDFSARVLHLGAPITLEFGCENGEPFCNELAD